MAGSSLSTTASSSVGGRAHCCLVPSRSCKTLPPWPDVQGADFSPRGNYLPGVEAPWYWLLDVSPGPRAHQAGRRLGGTDRISTNALLPALGVPASSCYKPDEYCVTDGVRVTADEEQTLTCTRGEVTEDSPEPLGVRKRRLLWAGNPHSATTWLIATGQTDQAPMRTGSCKRTEI